MNFRFVFAFCLAGLLGLAPKNLAADAVNTDTRLDTGWLFRQGEVSPSEIADLNLADWHGISLPHCWGWEQAQKGESYYRGPGWYVNKLQIAPGKNRRFYLRFEAASSVANVFLNGHWLGEHRGGFSAFCFEITTNLSASGTNVLAVRVSNAPEDDIAPLSGDFPVYGGIYRPVHLLETGGPCFARTDRASAGVAWLQTKVSADEAVLDVTAQISNEAKQRQSFILVTKILDASGSEVVVTNQTTESAPATTAPYWTRLIVPHPHLWNGRSDPYLYQAVVELRSTNDLVLDTVTQALGLRFYSVDPEKGFSLNGRVYPVHGVCRHQDRPDKGWAISEADMDEDIALMTEMGVTAVRCSHYEQSDYFYSLCDRVGILVWAEIPQVNAINPSATFAETSRNQLLDLIRQNINHPSIFAWSLFNEIGNGKTADPERELQDLNNTAHGEDPTRPTIAATSTDKFPQMNKIPDLLGRNHYPGWYVGKATAEYIGAWMDRERYTSRAGGFCVSEYGAGANPQQHEDNPQPPKPTGPWHPEEWQTVVHEADWAAIKSHPFVWGSFLWNMFDFTSYWRHEGGTEGLNDKGLVTADRKIKKDSFYFYKANWTDEPVLYIASRRFTARTNAITSVKIYSNAKTAELFINGASQGMRDNDGSAVFVWKEVNLAAGQNQIAAKAKIGGKILKDNCVWNTK